eukprot:IDg13659t1
MKAILLQCKLETAAQKILHPMQKAQRLFENAIEKASNESKLSACDTTSERLSVTDWAALVLYWALNEFETQLEHEMLPRIKNVRTGTENKRGEEQCEYSAENKKALRRRVEQAGPDLKAVATARHWLYYGPYFSLDVLQSVKTMGNLLQFLDGIGREEGQSENEETAIEWPFPEMLVAGLDSIHASSESMVRVEVSLQLSSRSMSVRFPRDPLFVGRKDIQQKLIEAILLPPSSGPVLLRGLPGVGKDTLLAETVRLPRILHCPDITLAMWLQGNTNSLFCQQLVDKFRVHRQKVVTPVMTQVEALIAIRDWLSSNKGWLLAIEDATIACTGLW